MKTSKQGTSKRRAIAATWAFTVLFVFLAISPIRAQETPASTEALFLPDSSIRMEVSYGYDDAAKGGRYIPVQVTLTGEKDRPFEGQLQVLSMESDYDIYQYNYPISVDAGATIQKIVDIPLGNRIDQLFVNLVDEAGNQVIHKRIKLNVSLEVPELFIGVLSDSPERLRYLNGIGVDYSMLRTRTIELNTENFPTDEVGLNLVDVLLVSDYKIRDLSERQSQVLVEWVRSGGVMILGTGARVDDTLGRFAPELLDQSYDSPTIRTIDMGQDYAPEGPGSAELTIPCADFSLSGANVIFSYDQLALLSSVAYSQGIIAAAAYDFADIGDFCLNNPSYMDTLLTNVLGEARINRLAEATYSGNSDQYWSVKSMINTGKVDRLPNLPLYVMEIMIYIILIGPGLYIFLKQRELQKFYRSGIVILSLLFTGIIYLMGSKTRFQDTFYTYARFLETSEESISESTYLNMQTPDNKPFEVSLDSSYTVKPITRSYYYEMTAIPKFKGDEAYKVAIDYQGEMTKIRAQNVTAFDPKYFQLEKIEDNKDHIGFTGEIEMQEGKIRGTITNSFTVPVEDAAVLLYDKMVLLGDMQPGETKSLDELEVLEYPLYHADRVAEKITGSDQYKEPDITDKNYMRALERTNLLIFYLNQSASSYTQNARVVGVCANADQNPVHIESSEVAGRTVVSSQINVYPAEEGIIYRSALMKKPTVVSGNYDAASNSLYGLDPLVLEYSLGNDVEIETLFFDKISEQFTNTGKASSLTTFMGSIYFYNHNTGNYDKMDENKNVYTGAELHSYLSPGNTITIKYLYGNVSEYNWDIILPVLNIVGRES